MNRLILLALIFLCTTSCRSTEKEPEVVAEVWEILCIDNVEYLYSQEWKQGRYLAPHYKTDGSLYLCEEHL